MRTTIKLDDDVFRAYKQRAAARGTTLAREIEDALRADLHSRDATRDEPPFEAIVFDGGAAPPLVDVNDNRALQELMDEEDAAASRR